MQDDRIDDTVLMAHADGMLDPATALRVEAALRDDPALARRMAAFAATRDRLSEAARALKAEAVPADLLARAQGAIDAARGASPAGEVPSFPARARRSFGTPSLALAAGLALAVGLGAGFLAALSRPGEEPGLNLASLSTPGLAAALDRLPSGAREALPDADLTIIASFTDAAGAFCREFELADGGGATLVAVACRDGGTWSPRFAVAAPATDGYAPASSLDALEAYLSAIGASAALSPGDEARLLGGSGASP